jgi:glutamate synthase (NADPH/NADH) small chain
MEVETDNDALREMRTRNLERIIESHCGDCLAPCELSCPAGCNIPGFIAGIAAGNDQEALRIIRETIPLPAILGRVCPAPCEDACRRHGVDEPVSICALKRHAADSERYIPDPKKDSGKRVAIVGAGPAGLTAAYYLLASGHQVTIIDANAQAGGMMRYGIPRFRLPEQVIETDIEPIVRMGARFLYQTVFGKDTDWQTLKQDHDALFLAIGAGRASLLGIPGEEDPCVQSGIGFLHRVATGNAGHPGKSVLVIGGGNTALDAARSALRLGAETVTVMYRRTRAEMPANKAEIEEALTEGVAMLFLASPAAIIKRNRDIEVQAVKMQLGEPDESGRRRPSPIEGSGFSLSADTVISATGQKVDLECAEILGLATTGQGTFLVDSDTLQTTVPGIFAGGDCISGADLAINAVAQGRRAAMSIDRYLRAERLAAPLPAFNSSYGARDQAPAAFYRRAQAAPRIPVPELSADQRRDCFCEITAGYSGNEAGKEASRCLQCRCMAVNDCRLRELATVFHLAAPAGMVRNEEFSIEKTGRIRLEREKCVDCGICVRTLELKALEKPDVFSALVEGCPTGALSYPDRSR